MMLELRDEVFTNESFRNTEPLLAHVNQHQREYDSSMQASKQSTWLTTLSALIGLALSAQAAPIPDLFGTGVDNNGALLAPGAVDPHYKLITSADTTAPGPDSI